MPFKSDDQRKYLYANKPEVAEEYANHGGIYPAPEGFNPGGGDAEVQGNTRHGYGDTYCVDGTEGTPVRDRDYDPRYDSPIQ